MSGAGPRAGSARVVVVADTHLQSEPSTSRLGRPVRDRDLPPEAVARMGRADAILHAGDLLDQGILDRLARLAPTWAVLGNNDRTLVGRLPETRTVELAGVTIGMVHDAGPTRGRAARMHRRFPGAAVVVFGHSHAPLDELGVDGQRLFNPGSPTQRRGQPSHTIGELDLRGGEVVGHRIVALD